MRDFCIYVDNFLILASENKAAKTFLIDKIAKNAYNFVLPWDTVVIKSLIKLYSKSYYF